MRNVFFPVFFFRFSRKLHKRGQTRQNCSAMLALSNLFFTVPRVSILWQGFLKIKRKWTIKLLDHLPSNRRIGLLLVTRIRDGADWIHMAQELVQWLAVMNTEPSSLTNSDTLIDWVTITFWNRNLLLVGCFVMSDLLSHRTTYSDHWRRQTAVKQRSSCDHKTLFNHKIF